MKCVLLEQKQEGTGVIVKKIRISNYPDKMEYLSGDPFDATGMEILASYGIENSAEILATAQIPATNCIIKPSIMTDGVTSVQVIYSENGVTVSTELKNIVVIPKMINLSITKEIDTTDFTWNRTFNNTGLEITAEYTDGTSTKVTDYIMKIGNVVLENGSILNDQSFIIGNNTVTISYTDHNGTTETTSFVINILKDKLKIPEKRNDLTYNGSLQVLDLKNFNSMLMTVSGNSATNAGDYIAIVNLMDTVHYEWEDETMESKNIRWSIIRLTISTTVPSQSGSLTYNGSSQSPTWSNYDSTKLKISGTTSATNAGTYTATFTPTENYSWSDGTSTPKNINWIIGKATGSLTLSKTSVSLTSASLSDTISITRIGDGTISYSPTSITGLTLSLSGNTLTITSDGRTNINSQIITISVAEGTNYTAPSGKNIAISVTMGYNSWGDEESEGTSSWWSNLKTWVSTAKEGDLSSCIGKTKKVILNTDVGDTASYNTKSHLIRCIGYNCNRPIKFTQQSKISKDSSDTRSSTPSLLYGDNVLIYYMDHGTNSSVTGISIYYSIDKGVNWTKASYPTDAKYSFSGSCYGNKIYILETTGYQLLRSTDKGKTWTVHTTPTTITQITYGEGTFVGIGDAGKKAYYSTDGVNWTSVNLPSYRYWDSGCYGDGVFLYLSDAVINSSDVGTDKHDGNIACIYSTDKGKTWTEVNAFNDGQYHNIDQTVYYNGMFIAPIYQFGKFIYSTDNGKHWSYQDNYNSFIAYASANTMINYNGTFILPFGSSGYKIPILYYSTNGINWNRIQETSNYIGEDIYEIKQIINCENYFMLVVQLSPFSSKTYAFIACDKEVSKNNSLTFETVDCLYYINKNQSNCAWNNIENAVLQDCIDYYTAFPGKDSIATVSIGTSITTNTSKNSSVIYPLEKVFLLSDGEHGYTSTNGYSSSYSEFDKYNTSRIPYQYFISNSSRVKNINNSPVIYGERSIKYNDASQVCCVNRNGTPSTANGSIGFSPAFVIG